MTFSRQLMLAMVVLVAATALIVSAFIYRDLDESVVPVEMRRLETSTGLLANRLDAYALSARADTLVLRGAAGVDGVMRGRLAGGRDPETGIAEEAWKDQVAELFESMARSKPNYVKIRLIGVADGGREIIRVDRLGDGGAVRRVPEEELQRKGGRPFVPDTLALPDGQVYVSRVDLNHEGGSVAMPVMPVLRTGTPIFTPAGRPFGLILINLDMRSAFADLRASMTDGARLFVVNEDGDYLIHTDRRREFGFEFGRRFRIQSDMPGIRAGSGAGSQKTSLGGEPYAVAHVATRLAGGPSLTVIKAVPYEQIVSAMAPIRQSALVAGALATALAVIVAIGLARSLAQPVRRMTDAVNSLRSGGTGQLPVDAPGEVGVLARAFQHYAQRESMFAAALESSEDAVIATTPEGIVTGWNPAAEALYGYTAEEVLGKSSRMLVAEDRQGDYRENLEIIASGGGFHDVEVVHLAKDGRRLLLEARVSPVRGPTGDLIGAVAMLSDVSEKRQLQAKFQMAFEASPSGMIMIDESGTIMLSNSQIARNFGYEADELIGQRIEVLVPDRVRAGHPEHVRSFLADPSARPIGVDRELRGRRKDGSEFAVEINLAPIRTETGLLVLAAVLDVSERNRAAAALLAKTRDLERSNAELEQFAYVASHDLREPLRMVASYTELLAERYGGKLDERADKYVGYIVDGARRMQRLVSDLLALSRVGTQGKPLEPVDSAKVVKNVIRAMTPTIRESNAQVTAGILPVVAADEVQLGQLFQNLIGNAIKFRAPDRSPSIIIDATRSDGAWLFAVRDNGIGIENQYSERIFQMFQRLHGRDEYEGNGIGLAIAKKIVERHGGAIWLSSTVGEGTVFYFSLPIAEERGIA
ncbi:PAS domain S-box protein [Emcibacter sp. SYSU 3D8]|uniref:PAS domain S-box protein n=1 Tax=Emcibacter sp. SYSU 3D8 TaxID=3133969 RepID=UPI0031FE81EC